VSDSWSYDLLSVVRVFETEGSLIEGRLWSGLDEDLDGLELPDLSAAHPEALIVAHKLRDHWTVMPPQARHDIIVEIVDEGFRTILTLPLSEVEAPMILQ
jgi:hypothetical protein